MNNKKISLGTACKNSARNQNEANTYKISDEHACFETSKGHAGPPKTTGDIVNVSKSLGDTRCIATRERERNND